MKIFLRRFHDEVALMSESSAMFLLDLAASAEVEPQLLSPLFERVKTICKPQLQIDPVDGIARIPIEGPLAYNPHPIEMLFGGVEDIRNVMSLAADAESNPDVKGVLYSVDSPGGFVTGGFDAADAMAQLEKSKPTVAHVGGRSASLAYMLTSQAGQIVAGRGAIVGSLGAFVMNVDKSRMLKNAGIEPEMFRNREATLKGIGVGGLSLSSEQRNHLNEHAEETFAQFMNVIETARGAIPAEARKGQTFYGEKAKEHKLVDNIGSEMFARGLLRQRIADRQKAALEKATT